MQLIIVLLIILLLFGGKKIPELMHGLGKGVTAFKKGIKEAQDELSKPVEDEKPKEPEDKQS